MIRTIFRGTVLWLCLCTALWGDSPTDSLTATTDDQGVLVREGTRPVLFYQRAEKASEQGRWPRSNYIHPLYDVSGNQVLTEDFPSDHGHHRGVFWAWHQVRVNGMNLGDAWACTDFVWDVQSVEFQSPASPLQLVTRTHWKSPRYRDTLGNMIPVVEETVRITVHPTENDQRKIDFEIRLLALESGVEIGGSDDEKGYGGFSPRIKLPAKPIFNTHKGSVDPQVTAVDAGTWVEVVGDGIRVKMIAAPDNPAPVGATAPTLWILRAQRSMQNAVYPGRNCVPVRTEVPTVLKYQLVIE
jgi:hypothetical protein